MRTDRRRGGRIAAVLVMAGVSLAPGAPAEASGGAGQVIVRADGQWVDTGIDVVAGAPLEITAWGTWKDGDTYSGPNGSDKPWPDNFLNLTDIGVCAVCARTLTLRWGALEGYIGYSPPAPGSYTSPAVRPEAQKVFFVGAAFEAPARDSGRLWLNKNADAYSNYTVDNAGHVVAAIVASTPSAGSPALPDWYCLGGVPGACDGGAGPGQPG